MTYGTRPPPPPPPQPPPPTKRAHVHVDGATNIGDSTEDNANYHCKPCDVSFLSKSALQAHLKSHIKCTKCSFTASKKVVSAHYKSKHGEYAGRGLKSVTIQTPGSRQTQRFKICVGNHPDDIQAWIAERKKRFPTRRNIEKKLEKNKRGRAEGKLVFHGDESKKRQKFDTGTSRGNAVASQVSSSISTLVACYGSSSDDDDDTSGKNTQQLEPNIQSSPSNSISTDASALKHKTKLCRFFLRNGTCKNGENCTYIHDIAQHESFKSKAETRKQKQSQRDRARNEAQKEMHLITTGRTQGNGKGGDSNRQTLLRKLLQSDIRRERSLCLQLLRYIVDVNFLQENKTKNTSKDAEGDEQSSVNAL